MRQVIWTNNADTTLAADLPALATSVSVVNASRFPVIVPGSGDWFYVTISNVDFSIFEILKVTARAGNILTVVRGQDDTTALAWSASASHSVFHGANVQNLRDIVSAASDADMTTFSRPFDPVSHTYINIGTWILWNPNFVRVFGVVGGVRTAIPWASMIGTNNLDASRRRYKDGVINNSNAPYLVNRINFTIPMAAYTSIEVDYTETKMLSHAVELIPAGRNMPANTPYLGKFGDHYPSYCEIWSKAILGKITSQFGPMIIDSVGGFIAGITVPSYLQVLYACAHSGIQVRYLVPNVLIDSFLPFADSYESHNLRIEAFQIPKKQRPYGGGTGFLRYPFGKYNFCGYFTRNPLPITAMITGAMGRQNTYFDVIFRLRNYVTNQVSDWLPLRIHAKKNFSTRIGISHQGLDSMHLTFHTND